MLQEIEQKYPRFDLLSDQADREDSSDDDDNKGSTQQSTAKDCAINSMTADNSKTTNLAENSTSLDSSNPADNGQASNEAAQESTILSYEVDEFETAPTVLLFQMTQQKLVPHISELGDMTNELFLSMHA